MISEARSLSAVFKDPVERIKGCKLKTSHSKPFKGYGPPKINIFAFFFGLPIRQMLLLTAKTADSGPENKNILKLDEKLEKKTEVHNGRPTTARGP